MSFLLAAWINDQDLRHIAVDAALGRPVDMSAVEGMVAVLEELLNEAAHAKEPSGSAADLVGTIARLNKERHRLESEAAEAEQQHEAKIAELEAAHETAIDEERGKRLEIEKETDALKAKIEELEAREAERAKVVPIGRKAARAADTKRIEELEAAVDHERAKREDVETRCRNVEAENARLKDAADRALAWQRRTAEADYDERLRTAEAKAVEEARVRTVAEDETNRLRLELRAIALGPAADAHRRVRIAVGHEIIEATGTAAKQGYIPTRRERKRTRL